METRQKAPMNIQSTVFPHPRFLARGCMKLQVKLKIKQQQQQQQQ